MNAHRDIAAKGPTDKGTTDKGVTDRDLRDSGFTDSDAAGVTTPSVGGHTLADRQLALVLALVADAPPPPSFDATRLYATREALLRKRCGEVARHLPLVCAELGEQFSTEFVAWACTRPRHGSAHDSHDFVEHLMREGIWTPPRRSRFGRRRHRGLPRERRD